MCQCLDELDGAVGYMDDVLVCRRCPEEHNIVDAALNKLQKVGQKLAS